MDLKELSLAGRVAIVTGGSRGIGRATAVGLANSGARVFAVARSADDLASLRAIQKRLKPGAALLLTVPANPWMWSAHDAAHHHFRRYTKKQLQELLVRAGFEVQFLSYFNSLLFPLIAAARIGSKIVRRDSADDSLPSAPINAVLEKIFGLEARFIDRVPMPFGVSLVAVVRRAA